MPAPNLSIAIQDAQVSPTGVSISRVKIQGSVASGSTPVFYACRVPNRSEATEQSSAAVSGSPGFYDVTMPYPGVLWYLWAAVRSGGGTSAQTAIPVGVVLPVSAGGNVALATDLGQTLERVLLDNKVGIETYLRQHLPETTLKFVQFGYGGDIDRYPSIIISQPKWSRKLVGIPVTYEYRWKAQIACMLSVANDEGDQLRPASTFASAVGAILDNPYYRRLTTLGGAQMYDCETSEGASEMVILGESRFAATATLVWEGQCLITEGR